MYNSSTSWAMLLFCMRENMKPHSIVGPCAYLKMFDKKIYLSRQRMGLGIASKGVLPIRVHIEFQNDKVVLLH
jgi:hypothetical protein